MEERQEQSSPRVAQNDNNRRSRHYDPTGRPRIIIGDVAQEATKAKRVFAPVILVVVLLVVLFLAGIWISLTP